MQVYSFFYSTSIGFLIREYRVNPRATGYRVLPQPAPTTRLASCTPSVSEYVSFVLNQAFETLTKFIEKIQIIIVPNKFRKFNLL